MAIQKRATLKLSQRKRFYLLCNSFLVLFSFTDVKGVLARQKEKPHVLNKAQLSIRICHKFLESEEGDVIGDLNGL